MLSSEWVFIYNGQIKCYQMRNIMSYDWLFVTLNSTVYSRTFTFQSITTWPLPSKSQHFTIVGTGGHNHTDTTIHENQFMLQTWCSYLSDRILIEHKKPHQTHHSIYSIYKSTLIPIPINHSNSSNPTFRHSINMHSVTYRPMRSVPQSSESDWEDSPS